MSEVVVTSWQHKTDPYAGKWEALFFQVEGMGQVPWWTREAGPNQEAVTSEDMRAAREHLAKYDLPFKAEMSFTEYQSKKTQKLERRVHDWEIIDGEEHIDVSVVAGKGAEAQLTTKAEGPTQPGLPPGAPPKATTQKPAKPNTLQELFKEDEKVEKKEKEVLKEKFPSLYEGQGQELEEHTTPPTPMMVAPIATAQQAADTMRQYQELTKAMLTDDDYQKIGNKAFKKKSAWRKYATAFNLDDRIINRELIRDTGGRLVEAEYTVEVTAPNGRHAVGVGACSIADKAHAEDLLWPDKNLRCKGPCDGRPHYSHPDHDIRATAHTRAKNRAISDLIGAGEVSAEEME